MPSLRLSTAASGRRGRSATVPRRSGRDPLKFGSLDIACAAGFLVYSASSVVTPISLVMLARELSFSLTGGGGVESVRASLIVAALLVSGLFAARWGKVLSVGASAVLLGFGLLAYSLAPTYGVVLMAAALVGVGGGVIEALINPLVQDLHPNDSGRYLNLINAFFSVGILSTVLVSGELLTRGVSWRFVMAGLSVLSIATGVVFLVLHRRLPFTRSHRALDVIGHKAAIVRHPRFWLFFSMMFLGGGAEAALTFWSASYIQLHFGYSPRVGAVGTACFAAGMIVGRIGSGWLVPQHRLWHLLIGSAAVGTLFALALPFVESIGLLLVVLFLCGLSIACFWPSLQSYSVDRIPLNSTSLFILLSCGGMPGIGAVSLVMGIIGDRSGLNASLFVIPALMAILSILLVVERRWKPSIRSDRRGA